jgi:hypothetical protein
MASTIKPALLLALLFASPMALRGEALFEGPVTAGYYGAPQIKFSQVNGDFALFVGGEGAFVANQQWMLGGGGYGLVTQHNVSDLIQSADRRIHLGYGGLKLGFIGMPEYLLHVTFGALIGAGGVSFDLPDVNRQNQTDAFFVFEPEIGGELNILENLRLNLSGTYRWITGVKNHYGVGSSDLSGVTATLSLKFGRLADPDPKRRGTGGGF